MTDTHAHGHGPVPALRVGPAPRVALLGALAVVALLTVVGLVRLWPDGAAVDAAAARTPYAAPGVTFPHADVTRVAPACPSGRTDGSTDGSTGAAADAAAGGCGTLDARVDDGAETGTVVTVPLAGPAADSGLRAGDRVQLMRIGQDGAEPAYSFYGVDRTLPLGLLAGLFALVVVAVARLRGLLALVGVVVGGAVVVRFMLPALLSGGSGVPVALVGASAIMYVVLYLAHGPSLRTSTALAGTLLGIAIAAGLGAIWAAAGRMSGVSSEAAGVLSSVVPGLDFRGLYLCALIVAGLGILNDVTITQASAVWELRAAAPGMTRRRLYASAMRIGRDHIASTIYTLVFAYAGAALATLLVLQLYQLPAGQLLATEEIADEVVSTLAAAIALVLAVPLTTGLGVLVAGGADPPSRRRRREDSPGRLDW